MSKDKTSVQPTVLIVDDEPVNIQALSKLLKEDYRILVATSGEKALDVAGGTIQPDVILLDYQMPGMDGYEVCRRLQASPLTRGIPVIFVTARDAEEDEEKCLTIGAADYISKPFKPGIVRARVKHQVERKVAERRLEELNATLEQRVEQRTAELQEAQTQLYLNEKMASIGHLAAGLAHEINNPVSFVATNFAALQVSIGYFANLIRAYRAALRDNSPENRARIADLEKDAEIDFVLGDLPQLFAESLDGIKRISSIVASMRNFARKDVVDEFTEFNINKGVEDTVVLARNAYKYSAEVRLELEELPEISCNAGQINQVILNLLVNAAQAVTEKEQSTGEKGQITIRTGLEKNYVFCEIADNGPGIAPEILPHLFDPFFTTKEPGSGTGIGLSISYDIIVNKHGGTLRACTGLDEGATFRFTLPVQARERKENEEQIAR